MLDAISDFWKPNKKQDAEAGLDVSQLKVGSSIGFGFIPQGMLSGKRATVHSINTYEFSGERLTSYVLDVESDTSVSLIVADGDGEKYIALSRRIPFAERMRMLDNSELLACMDNAEQKRLQTKHPEGEWRNWLADSYKKAIHGLSGKVMAGDFRSLTLPPEEGVAKEFSYTLLVSNNNEYAIEIEQYSDNRMEVYATVYRRFADIGEVKAPATDATPFVESPVAATPSLVASKPASTVASTAKELAALRPANDSAAKQQASQQTLQPIVQPAVAPKFESEASVAPIPLAKTPQLVSEQNDANVANNASNAEAKENPVIDSGKATTKPLVLDSLKDLKSLITPKNEPQVDTAETPSAMPASFEPVKAVVPTIQTLNQPVQSPRTELPKPPLPHPQAQPQQQEPKAAEAPQKVEQKAAAPIAPAPVPPAPVQEKPALAPVEAQKQPEQKAVQTPTAPTHVAASDQKTAEALVAHTVANHTQQQKQVSSTHKESEDMATYNATFNGKSESSLPQSEVRAARAVSGQHEVENDTVECQLPAANRVIEEAIRNEMRMSDVVRRIIALPVAQQEQVEIPVMLTDSDYHLLAIRYGIPAADRSAIKAKIVEEINDFSGSSRA